ncbi:MAG: FGGY family carbohydrate kinase [Candidatus Atabeyarchaeum deiterrae]
MPEKGHYLAVIDVGSTGARSAIFDPQGNLKGMSYKEYPEKRQPPGVSEQDPPMWWSNATSTMKEVLKKTNTVPKEIAALCVSTQRATTVAVDKDGNHLIPGITWMDSRTSPSIEPLKKKITRPTGWWTNSSLSKILWIKDNHPGIFNKTYKFIQVDGYLYHRLTGKIVTDYSNAIYGIVDMNTMSWSQELADTAGVPMEKWPDIYPSGTVLGEVTGKAAEETGLTAGLPVVMGGGDVQCSALGLGITGPGPAKATTGTGTFVVSVLEGKPVFDPGGNLFTNPHVLKGKWILEGAMPGTGLLLKWFKDQFSTFEVNKAKENKVDPYDYIVEEAKTIAPCSSGLLVVPLFTFAKGAIHGLSFGHTRKHVARAILECNAFAIRFYLTLMETMKAKAGEIRVDGGGSKSGLWNQIICDVTGKPVVIPKVTEGSALGAAILASMGISIHKSADEAIKSMVHFVDKKEPDAECIKAYNKMYATFQNLVMTTYLAKRVTGEII